MSVNHRVLQETSIDSLFISGDRCTYEIPVYQRNYAWEDEEIRALIQDVYDAFRKHADVYYIGTLVTYNRGNQRYEIIDGQQRLTTLRLILGVLGVHVTNQLTYTARKKSAETIQIIDKMGTDETDLKYAVSRIPDFDKLDESDHSIEDGYKCSRAAISDIPETELKSYKEYFLHKVRIVRYTVPRDIDLNQYFEVMNSRGEQLEMHEIVKANLMQRLANDEERKVFNLIWEACSNMKVYVQQSLEEISREDVFGKSGDDFLPRSFRDICGIYSAKKGESISEPVSILDILTDTPENPEKQQRLKKLKELDAKSETQDTFQPVIDFPNFLLIVLKITRMKESDFVPGNFQLDDKELLNEFHAKTIDVRQFAYNLLKARFFLDNYMVHHDNEEDTLENNPWKLQVRWYNRDTKHWELKNLISKDKDTSDAEREKEQAELVHLLSMFEVSFVPRQRKNYLFYCLLYLMQDGSGQSDTGDRDYCGRPDAGAYRRFVERLADSYFQNVYMDKSRLNQKNTPLPNSFDSVILDGRKLAHELTDGRSSIVKKSADAFVSIYGDGQKSSDGVPLFVFNYMDFRIWKYYADTLRGESIKKESPERKAFFKTLGCSDFGLDIFNQFYFSRTRRSLEHYYPQANVGHGSKAPTAEQINCFGNYAMIGSEVNSAASNWSPKTKLDTYLDPSGKISRISVASLKFTIMLQMCRDRDRSGYPADQCWTFEQMKEHQKCMVSLLTA